MSYRDGDAALQTQIDQLEARLASVRRERAALEAHRRDEPDLVAELDRLRRSLHARAPRLLPLLDDVRVASPCHERWDAMTGDDQVRFCGGCQKNVYNLSAMTREAAEALIHEREGRLCVRFYRRADGTVLTADCAVGVRRKRVRVAVAVSAVAALAAGAAASMHSTPSATAAVGRPTPSTPTVATTPVTESPTIATPTTFQGQMEMGQFIASPDNSPRHHPPSRYPNRRRR